MSNYGQTQSTRRSYARRINRNTPIRVEIPTKSRARFALEAIGLALIPLVILAINVGIIAILPISKDARGAIVLVEGFIFFMWCAWEYTGCYDA